MLPGSDITRPAFGRGSTVGSSVGDGERAPPVEPERLGRLEIVRCIGAGGMGEVYEAHDVDLDRRVAVKLVRSDITSRDAVLRIMREAQLMARVTHPNVVRIYDVGRVDGRVYITMELVRGATLGAWLEQTERPWREILECFLKAGRGLAAAHRMGLVHRDFKPANVLIGDDGRVLVADFGLARSSSGDSSGAGLASTATDRAAPLNLAALPVTLYGTVLGTPGYMSPEQLLAAPVDARSDLFSFCVALHEALYGIRPFAGASTTELLADIGGGMRPPPRRGARMPERIAVALTRGLAAEPARRFATMDDLLAELERALVRPRRYLGASLLAAASLISAGAAADVGPFADPDPCASAGAAFAAAWTDERAAAMHDAFAATRLSFAAGATERASTRIAAYAEAGQRASLAACTATHVEHGQSSTLFDLRMACLGRREAALRNLVDALIIADAPAVQGVIDSVAALPAIDDCADIDALVRTAGPPEDPAVAREVEAARDLLARGEAQRATGRYDAGVALAEEAVRLTAHIAYDPVRAEALALRGRLHMHAGDPAVAEETLLDAVELAEASRHDELAADVWIELVRLANLYLHDPTRGAAWIRRASAAQRRLGDAPERRIAVLGEQGTLHGLEHDHASSVVAYQAALELVERHSDDTLMLGKLTHGLANAYDALGRFAEARAAYDRALAATEFALGAEHPLFARVLHDFAVFLMLRGEYDAAQAQLERVLAITTRAHGRAHHLNGTAHISLVQVALSRGDFGGAVDHAELATRILGEALKPEHPAHVDAAVALGTARFFAGDPTAALAAYTTARDLHRKFPRDEPIAAATISIDIAETLVALERYPEAEAAFADAERTLASAAMTDADLSARVLTGRGRIALAAGDHAAAVESLEAALELRRGLPEDTLALEELQAALVDAKAGLSH